MPVDVESELCIKGDGLGRGHHGRPGLTVEWFVPHPYARRSGGRLYRSGDRVRHRHDRPLEFLGRLDYNVKVRVFRVRVEPGGGQTALGEHPEVAEAAAAVPPRPRRRPPRGLRGGRARAPAGRPVRDRLGVDVPVHALFEGPTVPTWRWRSAS